MTLSGPELTDGDSSEWLLCLSFHGADVSRGILATHTAWLHQAGGSLSSLACPAVGTSFNSHHQGTSGSISHLPPCLCVFYRSWENPKRAVRLQPVSQGPCHQSHVSHLSVSQGVSCIFHCISLLTALLWGILCVWLKMTQRTSPLKVQNRCYQWMQIISWLMSQGIKVWDGYLKSPALG